MKNSQTDKEKNLLNQYNFVMEKIEKLDDVISTQKNCLTSDYLIGLYNGLLTAKTILTNQTVQFADCIKEDKYD